MAFAISSKPIEVIRPGLKLAIIGDCFVDVVASNVDKLPEWGHNSLASSFSQHTGGSSGNVASHIGTFLSKPNTSDEYAATMNTFIERDEYPSPLYITSVGTDDFGRFFLSKLSSRKVNVSHAQVRADHPTGGCVVLSSTNDRSFISCLGTNDHFSVEYLLQSHILDALSECDHIHISNLLGLPSLHRPTASGRDFVDFLQEIRSRNPALSISIDPQHANNGLWLGEDNILTRILPHVDIFLPNDIEVVKVARAVRALSGVDTDAGTDVDASVLPAAAETSGSTEEQGKGLVPADADICLFEYALSAEPSSSPSNASHRSASTSTSSSRSASTPTFTSAASASSSFSTSSSSSSPVRSLALTPALLAAPHTRQPIPALHGAATRVLRAMRVGAMVVVTEGAAGATAFVRSEDKKDDKGGEVGVMHAVKVPAYNVQLVDSTGGGDAFEAAFLLALLTVTRRSPTLRTPPSSSSSSDAVSMNQSGLPSLPPPALALSQLPFPSLLAALPIALSAGCASGAIRVTRVSGSDHCPSWADVCRLVATANADSIPAVEEGDEDAAGEVPRDVSGFVGDVAVLKGHVAAKL